MQSSKTAQKGKIQYIKNFSKYNYLVFWGNYTFYIIIIVRYNGLLWRSLGI